MPDPVTMDEKALDAAREAYNAVVISNYESLQGGAGLDAEDAAFAKILAALPPVPEAPEGAVAWMTTAGFKHRLCWSRNDAERAADEFRAEGSIGIAVSPLYVHPLPPSDAPSNKLDPNWNVDVELSKAQSTSPPPDAPSGEGPYDPLSDAMPLIDFLMEIEPTPDSLEGKALIALADYVSAIEKQRFPLMVEEDTAAHSVRTITFASPPPDAGRRGEVAGRILARWMGRLNDYDTDVADWRSTCDEAAAEILALCGVPAHDAGETK